jgi:hypothetical protein
MLLSSARADEREHESDDGVVERVVGADRFAAGGRVELDKPGAGDALAAGGAVVLGADTVGDALLVGGTVDVRGRVGQDLYAGGGSLRVDAAVAESARLAGGDVRVGRGARFGGDSAVVGGTVRFDGAAGSALYLAGGTVRFDGEAAGDVVIAGRDVEVGPRARIAGALLVRGPAPPRVAEGARIAGGVRHELVQAPPVPDGAARVVGGMLFVAWVLGLLLLGVLSLGLFPNLSRRAAAGVTARPLASAGLGFALLVGIPAGAVLLMVTVIGIPMGLLALALYFPLLVLGYLAGVVAAGDALLARFRPAAVGWRPRALAFALTLVVLALAARIPWIGPWVGFALLVFGLGSLALTRPANAASA